MPTTLDLYEKLRPRLGDEESKFLLEYISASVEKHAAAKDDLAKTENKLILKIGQVKSELELKIEQVRSELKTEIQKSRSDIIKWMFLFWIGQLASLIAILQIFFRK
ncbi:MAG: hypothetical protein GW873_01440 [Nitrospirae bacterium]|nr:hypothetical protein [Nitrospirota bacterium]PIV40365.1 MAG: hypothetical protein COS28_09240 [Nitrospirae bacterium CG02_land_8_20_14_3_00_44_33]PIV67616.1 MAG: hypothetical protein COS10_00180 [Nitrospirae bacterium CG01_land_8_20_14_3_00_44_22]PIW90779.1 MAG: hypothetical protein COZ93_00305 [Nitrospirae bacterium CG_4_8_14_3_um_filter_44_28]PJA81537.1 MAG: hypothetical protein CO147_09410 [Nitrospirae bacterium CG_4_9_14_3_um_filter_44_28]